LPSGYAAVEEEEYATFYPCPILKEMEEISLVFHEFSLS
jgi:hypothetical protein